MWPIIIRKRVVDILGCGENCACVHKVLKDFDGDFCCIRQICVGVRLFCWSVLALTHICALPRLATGNLGSARINSFCTAKARANVNKNNFIMGTWRQRAFRNVPTQIALDTWEELKQHCVVVYPQYYSCFIGISLWILNRYVSVITYKRFYVAGCFVCRLRREIRQMHGKHTLVRLLCATAALLSLSFMYPHQRTKKKTILKVNILYKQASLIPLLI